MNQQAKGSPLSAGKTSKPRTHSPITGLPYPKCKVDGCTRNVYAAGCCYGHQK
jgi:hypothetical protein